jgi:aspartate-semialdehyde dehydrogenase
LGRPEWSGHDVYAYATHGGGRTVSVAGREIEVHPIPESPPDVDFAFLAVPNDTARILVSSWTEAGIRIVDKSSAFRMAGDVPLVVPEINGDLITEEQLLIANPNCSTIQLAMALFPLDRELGLNQVRVSTYQAVSGAGTSALDAWRDEAYSNDPVESPFPRRIHANVIPMIGSVDDEGWFTEERKVMEELPKILAKESLAVSCTAVRVPVEVGHSEAVEATFDTPVNLARVAELLDGTPEINLKLNPEEAVTPLEAAGDDLVHVSRLRVDPANPHSLHIWVVSDNLRKGAATNALQILSRWVNVLDA